MTPTEARISALLDQLSAKSRDGGRKVQVSEADLTALTTMAWVGIFALGVHDNAGHRNEAMCRDKVRRCFEQLNAKPKTPPEVPEDYTTTTALAGACAAAIRDRFGAYLLVDGR